MYGWLKNLHEMGMTWVTAKYIQVTYGIGMGLRHINDQCPTVKYGQCMAFCQIRSNSIVKGHGSHGIGKGHTLKYGEHMEFCKMCNNSIEKDNGT